MQRFRFVLRRALICIAAAIVAAGGTSLASAQSNCQFNSAGGKIKHVIYIQFDNTP